MPPRPNRRQGPPRRGGTPPRRDDRGARGGKDSVPKPKGRGAAWGGLARRAAGAGGTSAPPGKGKLRDAPPSKAAEAFRSAAGGDAEEVRVERVDDGVRGAAKGAVERGTAPDRTPARRKRGSGGGAGPDTAALVEELGPVVGPSTAPKLAARLADAGRAFAAERYTDARRILRPLAERAPASAAVRELHGLTLYRLGKWAEAIRELEAFRQLSGSTEQHPVLADAYRALQRYDEVEALWDELRKASPSAELVAEGRIVYAGSLADRGDVAGAIAVIEPAVRGVKPRKEHHLRLFYVLADLHERAGDLPRARMLFDRILRVDAGFADAAARRRAL